MIPVITRVLLFAGLLMGLSFSQPADRIIRDSLHVAYYPRGEDLNETFLREAAQNGYKYILAEFHLSINQPKSMREKGLDFQKAFTQAHKAGLKLIPLIQMASVWSLHWLYAKENWNQNIQMTRIAGTTRSGKKFYGGMPSLSPDLDGIDHTFIEFLEVLKKSHVLSEVPWPLEYIHLGHDEPAHYKRLIIGDCDTSDSGEKWSVDSVLEVSPLDRGYILGHKGQEQKAVQELMVSHVYRRAEQISTYLGDDVQLMIYADAWDKQSNGLRDLKLFNGKIVHTAGLVDLPGLTDSQKSWLKKKLILMPWNYDINYDPDGDGGYQTGETFKRFSAHGFDFVYAHEFLSGQKSRKKQATEFVKFCQEFEKCLGFASVHWCGGYQNGASCYESMENLQQMRTQLISQ